MFLNLLALALTASFHANAAEVTQSRELKSESGVEIRLDYRVSQVVSNSNKPSAYTYAQPVYLTIRHPQLKSSDKVRVVLINRENFIGSCGFPSYTKDPHYILDLEYRAGQKSFVAEFSQARILLDGKEVPLQPKDRFLQLNVNSYCNSVKTAQEIAVVINGLWQTDPVNKTPNFKVQMMPSNP
ncbi:MAG: hypothetical protein K2X47_19025 [Bdellovibrionales bacterium]|nr:hypothetical protein [Bdellovibrionales bacterium]